MRPRAVAVVTDACDFAGWGSFTCVLVEDGTVQCWGSNNSGQLGDGTTTNHSSPAPVSELSDVDFLAAGSDFVCAHKTDGTIWCWGANRMGALGDGTTTNRSTPVQVRGLEGLNIVDMHAYYAGVCALTSTGSLVCWGQLYGPPWSSLTPVEVLTGVSSVDGGNKSIMYLTLTTGELRFFGNAGWGAASAYTPAAVPGFANGPVIGAGCHDHSCFVDSSTGQAYCWGRNEGKFATASGSPVENPNPIRMGAFDGAVDIINDASGACALLADGTMRCWGTGSNIAIGTSNSDYTRTPLRNDLTQLSAGWSHACGVANDGRVWCWGNSPEGAVGPRTTSELGTFLVPGFGD